MLCHVEHIEETIDQKGRIATQCMIEGRTALMTALGLDL
jgi:hypothetical protein